MREIETRLTWWMLLRIWWAIVWRSMVASLLTTLLSLGLGWLFPLPGMTGETAETFLLAICGLFYAGLEFFILAHVLNRDYGSFRIAVFRKLADGSGAATSSRNS